MISVVLFSRCKIITPGDWRNPLDFVTLQPMKKGFKYRLKLVPAFICIAVVAMLAVNDIVFLHAHELPNGEIIIHAHPYNKSGDSGPLKNHHHSTSEYLDIQNIHLFFPFFVLSLPVIVSHCFSNQSFFLQHVFPQVCLSRETGRSPPYV